MIFKLKYQVVKFIENIPLLQILIYNNLHKFKFLFPHDKDYLALKILFNKNEKRDFIDVGGNIGLSTIGFRELGFKNNNIHVFEPDKLLIGKYLEKLKKYYKGILIYNFGLSSKNTKMKLYKAYYGGNYFHFNNSFNKKYIKNKIKENYPKKYNKFYFKSQSFLLRKFDLLDFKYNACFVKIDVEGLDHEVLQGMIKYINKIKPIILIEYNQSNFKDIYKKIKKNYNCYRYEIEKNSLIRLSAKQIKSLIMGNILEKKYRKNSVNLFYIHKNYSFQNFNKSDN